jgi:hypothetical protein
VRRKGNENVNFEKTANRCNTNKTLLIEYNNESSSLILKNDRFGTVPIFYYSGKEWFIFSTSFFDVLKYLEPRLKASPKVATV